MTATGDTRTCGLCDGTGTCKTSAARDLDRNRYVPRGAAMTMTCHRCGGAGYESATVTVLPPVEDRPQFTAAHSTPTGECLACRAPWAEETSGAYRLHHFASPDGWVHVRCANRMRSAGLLRIEVKDHRTGEHAGWLDGPAEVVTWGPPGAEDRP